MRLRPPAGGPVGTGPPPVRLLAPITGLRDAAQMRRVRSIEIIEERERRVPESRRLMLGSVPEDQFRLSQRVK